MKTLMLSSGCIFLLTGLIGCRNSMQDSVEIEGTIITAIVHEADVCELTIIYLKNADTASTAFAVYGPGDFDTVNIVVIEDDDAVEFHEGQTVRLRYEKNNPEKVELVEQ